MESKNKNLYPNYKKIRKYATTNLKVDPTETYRNVLLPLDRKTRSIWIENGSNKFGGVLKQGLWL